ncbi:tight junction protein ZO-3 isoform X2 [Denticeps clupeoides]|uniref:Tight junction protein ZO-3 n=2 Tax=Denticeps clupeoides TaxID=299321 RepID=A0AAY4ECQ6_9TELE|nr:tight junction protein ZO-3-like isoform X2 [Denticeps clupeoides]XP_028857250.1 tight junction protein ZO-3-like isoform X2 [Denticeps clupeoides]
MEDMTIWEQHTITLNKDPKMGFGFALSGGRDKPNPDTGDVAVVVSDVIRNGPAMGRLQTKDLIVMVNGVSMENVTSNYTIQHLKSCGKTANVTVKRPRVIQIPVSNRPARSGSQSNLLSDEPNYRRPRQGSDTGSYDRLNRRDQTPDRNGHDLPLMSGYKRLPNQEVPSKPMKATLVKKKPTDEYGMKLGSQIFIKHMTATGLAAKEGTLQEGDLVLKINGMTTENLSLLETKHLVEKSKGKLTMVVLRDDRKFLVTIPEVADSPQNSEDEGREDSSSELEDISDLEAELPKRDRQSRRRTRRSQADAPMKAKPQESPPIRSTGTPRRVPSESESDHSNSPPPARRHSPSPRDSDRYRILTGISTLPNPRASPIPHKVAYPSSSSQPRKPVSESDSDRSASPPPRRDNHMRYKVLPDLTPNLRASPRGPSPYRPPAQDSESESDSSSGPTKRQVVPANQDSVSRYRMTPEVTKAPPLESPRRIPPLPHPTSKVHSDSESEASYKSDPKPESPVIMEFKNSKKIYGAPPEKPSSSLVFTQESSPKFSPAQPPPPEDSSGSERALSSPRRHDSIDHESDYSFPRAANGTLRSDVSRSTNANIPFKNVEEPLYSIPPDAVPSNNDGYSSDQNVVQFVKDGSVGLRLVGGNDVGIFVGGVQPNSPAQKQGMREGDQIINVNGKDFNQFTREEAAMFMLNVRSGETIKICTQNKMDIYKKILKSSIGDAFYIRTHFDREAEVAPELAFTRGEVFRVLDTMHRGKLGNWLAVRMGNDLHELDKGTIPNQARAETMASIEQAQRATTGERQGTGPRAEFWKLRGLRGAKKNTRRTRDDLLQLTIQGKFPAYEKVLLREANFKRPIVILGPLNDIAMEKLAREMPDEFEVAEMVPRSGGDSSSSTVIKLDTVRTIAEQDKHPLLDITPTAVERLNYIQYHPIVLFLDPHSRKDVKVMRQRQAPDSNKSSRRLYAQALKIRKHYSHLFSARIDLQPNSNVWYELLKERIRHQQSKPVWVSEVNLERGGEEELDALSRDNVSDYLSCDSRAASDYEDTDGEPYTDAELYTDNEDLEEPLGNQEAGLRSRHRGSALARSSEPATGHGSPEPLYHPEPLPEEEPTYNLPPEVEATPVLHPVYHSARPAPKSPPQFRKAPSTHSFSDSDFSLSDLPPPDPPTEEPPDFRAPDPSSLGTGSATPPPESPPPVTLSTIEKKLQQARQAGPQEKRNPTFLVLAHHEAVQCRRTHIQGSDSSENNNDDENEDIEWGPATEL